MARGLTRGSGVMAGIDPGERVLDVGCGTGNVAVTARSAGADVVGVDLSGRMLELARDNATIAGHRDKDWVQGDAEGLPFCDDAFDAVLSNFGHVFAPRSDLAGRELLRVAAPGGRVAFTAWTPTGVVGRLTEVLTEHVTPPNDPWSHLQWGDPEFVRDQFGDAAELGFQRRIARFRYVSPDHFWREFAEESGPLAPAMGQIDDPDARRALRRDAIETLSEWFGDNAVRVEYLQVRAVTGPG